MTDINFFDVNAFKPSFPTLESNLGFFGDLWNLVSSYFAKQTFWFTIFQQNIFFLIINAVFFILLNFLLGFLPFWARLIVSFTVAWFIVMPIVFGLAVWLGIMKVI